MAEAMGVTGIRVEDPTEVRPAIERMLRHDGPVLVDVVTNPSELSMPPKVSGKQAGVLPYTCSRRRSPPRRRYGGDDRE